MCDTEKLRIASELEHEEIRSLQKEEAIKRMEKLGLLSDIIEYFKVHNKLYRSENFRIGTFSKDRYAIVYFLDEQEEKLVREWEKETGNLVYHVIKNRMEFGTCLSCLYVSKDPSDWKDDMDELENYEDGSVYPLVYVFNLENRHFSEYGCIGVQPSCGGLLRTA